LLSDGWWSWKNKACTRIGHRTLDALKPEASPYRVRDSRCPGLAVRFAGDGSITFDLAFRIKGGVSKRLSLGRFPEVTLDGARDRANELTKAGRAGHDLIGEEKAAKIEAAARLTVEKLIERYLARAVRGKLRTAKEIESRLRRALGAKFDIAAADIKRRDLRELFDETEQAGFSREAEKRRQTVGAMFRWAVGADLIEADPCMGIAAYNRGTPRDRVLSKEEIGALWEWLDQSDYPSHHGEVLRLQLALGARCGEVAGICAEEIDLAAGIWTLPANRSKNGRHRVTPVVGIAAEILKVRMVKAGPLFKSETGKPLQSTHVGQSLLHRRERLPIQHFATHDLRRTFVTHLDSMGLSQELIADLIGHEQAATASVRTLVRHYIRSDRLAAKKTALESWDRRLREIIEGVEHGKKVIALRS
jgi:integrase